MATDADFGEFTLEVVHKPVGASPVTEGQIPEKLAAFLAEEAGKALDDQDYEVLVTAADEKQAKLLSSYSAAWGKRQEPRLYIHKLPNGKRYPANVARLAVELDDPDAVRAGRPVGGHKK
jgi:hypothetical protein